ncbi:MAG: hypothetical protein ED556_10970 [Winogradskyella sp.]|nr:MAG: hypothetical protein ED556_10970 [Winogradskyella sp.]
MKNTTIIILIVTVFFSYNSSAQNMDVTKTPNAMEMTLRPMNKKSNSEGLNKFLANPRKYAFKCGCEAGEIKSALLNEDSTMKMTYYYMCNGKKLHGFLNGKYNSNTKKFTGIYNTENKMFYGTIKISWNAKGEGSGVWNNGAGTVSIYTLKK